MGELAVRKVLRSVMGGGTLLVALALATLTTNAVFAGEGGSQGDGGQQGCGGEGWSLDTCYGATWRKYSIQDIADGKYSGMSYDAATDTVTVKGKDPNNFAYAKGGEITGCYNPDAEGNGVIWRYGVVAYAKGYYADGTFYVAGDQVGMLGINGNSDSRFDSQYFGGWMNYIPESKGGTEWTWVQEEYRFLQELFPEIYTKGWGYNANGDKSDLAWFCRDPKGSSGGGGGGETPQVSSYWAKSNVSDRASETGTSGQSDWQTTNIVNSYTTVSTSKTAVYTGSAGYLTFSHNIYADVANASGISWGVTRTVEYGGRTYEGLNAITSYVQVASEGSANHTSGATGAATVGTASTTTERGEDGSLYIAGPRNYTDGGSYYILRDHYKANFIVAGDYTFCEELSVNGVKLTKVCSVVHVTAAVGECDIAMTAGQTVVSSKVRNYRLSAAYADTVYAMPGDDIVWRNCYAPGAQMYYNSEVTTAHGAEGVCYNTANTNQKFGNVIAWSGHGFEVSTTSPYGVNDANPNATTSANYVNTGYPAGWYSSTAQSKNNSYVTKIVDGGKTYTTTVGSMSFNGSSPTTTSVTNQGIHTWTASCPYWNSCCYTIWGFCRGCTLYRNESHSHTNNYYTYSYDYAKKTAQSSVIIPYNYTNTTGVKLLEEGGMVYAGETANVRNAKVTVGDKWNSATQASYITQVDGAKIQLVAYIASSASGGSITRSGSSACAVLGTTSCTILTQKNGNLNDDANASLHNRVYEGDGLKGDDGIAFNGRYSVFDTAAGNYYCVALAVYPATSGAPTNTVASGDNQWYISEPSCARVAKKPSVQVLGGSILMTESGSIVSTQTAEKNNLLGISKYAYSPRSSAAMSFGSWVEEGIISNGKVRGLASGAALGAGELTDNSGRTFTGRLGGASNSYCKNLVPLSFANMSRYGSGLADAICSPSGSGSQQTGLLNAQITETNRKALVDYFAAGTKVDENLRANDGFGDYYILKSPTGKDVYLTDGAGPLNISGGTLSASTTRVVRISGNVNINGNIIYSNGGYSSAGLIPKVVIYASGNINIACGVGRVDAMLIAGGTVNTCYNGEKYLSDGVYIPNYDASSYAKQLTINGVVVANRIELNRTYGAATGTNSGTPAEIINYDSSSILWGRAMADASESDVMSTVYQHELAPRY